VLFVYFSRAKTVPEHKTEKEMQPTVNYEKLYQNYLQTRSSVVFAAASSAAIAVLLFFYGVYYYGDGFVALLSIGILLLQTISLWTMPSFTVWEQTPKPPPAAYQQQQQQQQQHIVHQPQSFALDPRAGVYGDPAATARFAYVVRAQNVAFDSLMPNSAKNKKFGI
jgi:hypothetical protein